MSNKRLRNKKRHAATFEKRKRKSRIKAIIYIMAIICFLVGIAFFGGTLSERLIWEKVMQKA